MTDRHRMEATRTPDGAIFTCPECGKKVTMTEDFYAVLNKGDFDASHHGSIGFGDELTFAPIGVQQVKGPTP
jgi:hypothetical protein